MSPARFVHLCVYIVYLHTCEKRQPVPTLILKMFQKLCCLLQAFPALQDLPELDGFL